MFLIGEYKLWVAVLDGEIVGMISIRAKRHISLLFVDDKHQRMGIGTALRDIFIDWAKRKNAAQYVIGVLKNNTKARKVYESWGGQLSEYEHDFVQMNVGYPEVFYTFQL